MFNNKRIETLETQISLIKMQIRSLENMIVILEKQTKIIKPKFGAKK